MKTSLRPIPLIGKGDALLTHKVEVFRCCDRHIDCAAVVCFHPSAPAGGLISAGAAAGRVHALHLHTQTRTEERGRDKGNDGQTLLFTLSAAWKRTRVADQIAMILQSI